MFYTQIQQNIQNKTRMSEERNLFRMRAKIEEREKHIESLQEKINVVNAEIMHLTRLNSIDWGRIDEIKKKLNDKNNQN